MAEIPVEKKSNSLWWLWLLGLLLIGALLFWWLAGDDDVDVAVNDADNVATMSGDHATVGTVVDMNGLRVTNVTGDMSFYAEDASGTEHFIVFDETLTPGTAREGMVDIDRGDRVDIEGTVRDRNFTLPATVNATIPAGQPIFIFATNVDEQ